MAGGHRIRAQAWHPSWRGVQGKHRSNGGMALSIGFSSKRCLTHDVLLALQNFGGPATAVMISEASGVSEVTVRRHLLELKMRKQAHIAHYTESKKRAPPAAVWAPGPGVSAARPPTKRPPPTRRPKPAPPPARVLPVPAHASNTVFAGGINPWTQRAPLSTVRQGPMSPAR